jgi:hypothetical protein
LCLYSLVDCLVCAWGNRCLHGQSCIGEMTVCRHACALA